MKINKKIESDSSQSVCESLLDDEDIKEKIKLIYYYLDFLILKRQADNIKFRCQIVYTSGEDRDNACGCFLSLNDWDVGVEFISAGISNV